MSRRQSPRLTAGRGLIARPAALGPVVRCVFEPLEPRELLDAQIPAFPGAEGYGMFTTGGRGLNVYEVTTLADSGPGSLRDAVSQSNRTIVFRVSGTIALNSRLDIERNNITIAGQTAPGDGITLKNYALRVGGDNIIIRYIRVRVGDQGGDNQSDGIGFMDVGASNVMFDHCSVSWAIDENFSMYGLPNITIQWCIISEALHDSNHPKGPHSMGGIQNGRDMTIHHNIYISNNDRNPKFNIADWWPGQNTDFRNNVVYNWGARSTWGGNGGSSLTNVVNNYYKAGPDTIDPNILLTLEGGNPGEWYVDGNYVYGYPGVTADNWTGVVNASGTTPLNAIVVDQPFSYAPVTTQSATDAYTSVLQFAGCTVPARDSVDTRVLADVANGTGAIIDSQTEVGGWPVLNSTTPPTDSDHDGMPDAWELTYGLDPYDPADRNGDFTGDGYTNLETYLNSLVPILGSVTAPYLPSQAFWPYPADGGTQEDANIELKWKAGFNVTAQRTYFGTSPTLTEADFKEEKVFFQYVNNKQLITGSYYDPGPLELDTTYYWRIDSVNDNGVTTGQTWSFTPGLPVAGPGGGNRMEAENMTLRRAFVEGGGSNWWAAVPSETGTMRYTFDKASGIYQLSVRYIDESDGEGLFSVYVNSDLVGQWTANINNDQFVTRYLGNVQINTGDVIKVTSNRHQDELGRVDYVDTVFQGTDTTAPTSSVAALPSQVTSPFEVSWSGSDGGTWVSGLANHDIYVSDNGGASALWLDHTTDTSADYDGVGGHTYAFYSRARDKAGNVEAAPATPDAQTTVAATVAGRWVFYNRSSLDGNDPAANAADDAAIATDKQALLPGQTATAANYTSYSRGTNGVMADIAGLANPTGLTVGTVGSYFAFRAGDDDNPAGWSAAAPPVEVLVRQGAGAAGSDRVTLVWADRAIINQWLEVTVLANGNTGLAGSDVFYFANLPADADNDGEVDSDDYSTLESNFGGAGGISEGDFNLDGSVQFDDYQILECAFGNTLPALDFSPPAPEPPPTEDAADGLSEPAALAFIQAPSASSLSATQPDIAISGEPLSSLTPSRATSRSPADVSRVSLDPLRLEARNWGYQAPWQADIRLAESSRPQARRPAVLHPSRPGLDGLADDGSPVDLLAALAPWRQHI